MVSGIKKVSNYLYEGSAGKHKRTRIIIAFVIIIALLVLNRVYFYRFVSDDLRVYFQQANFLFLKNLSPYDEDIQKFIISLANESDWHVKDFVFDIEIAVWQLIFYFPFSLIGDFSWGASLFLTFTQCSIILSVILLFQLLEISKISLREIILYVISIFSLFLITNILQGNLAPLNLLFLISTIYFLDKDKQIISGIFLGLLLFDSVNIILVLAMFVIGMFRNKQYISIIWSGITVAMSALFMAMFDRNWIFGWLKNLFLSPKRVPFLTYPDALHLKYNIPSIKIFSIISFLLIIWFAFEAWRMIPTTRKSWLWLLGLSAVINHYLIIQKNAYSAILFIIPVELIVCTWRGRLKRSGQLILGLFASLLTIFSTIIYFVQKQMSGELFTNLYMILLTIIIVLNLYWSRRWVINPYEFDNNVLEF